MKRANEVLEKAARSNKTLTSDLKEKVQLLYARGFKDKEAQGRATVMDLMRTPNLRKKTLMLYFVWLSIAFSYYGLSLNTNDLNGDVYWNFFFSGLTEFPAAILCMVTIDRFGRKKPFVIYLLLAGISCLSCIFMKKEWHQATTILVMGGKMFVMCSFEFVYLYSAEIFPTVARNVGVGSCSTVARIGSSAAPFMRDLAKVTNPSVPMVLFGVLSILSGFLVMLLPETLNHPAPETLHQAEEFGKSYKEPKGNSDMDTALKPLM